MNSQSVALWENKVLILGGCGGRRGEGRREGGGEGVKCNFTQPPETSTPVRLCPPAGYGTPALGSAPPSQMLCVCEMGRGGGRGGKGGGREEEGDHEEGWREKRKTQ